jgi:hypothetical protein
MGILIDNNCFGSLSGKTTFGLLCYLRPLKIKSVIIPQEISWAFPSGPKSGILIFHNEAE